MVIVYTYETENLFNHNIYHVKKLYFQKLSKIFVQETSTTIDKVYVFNNRAKHYIIYAASGV